MPIIKDEYRRLATIETVAQVAPIEGADAIEQATVRGWTVVVKKGEFHPGDGVVYIEVDTALPLSDPRFAFLAARGSKTVSGAEYHVLRTAKLRGVYSQGLAVPVSGELAELPVGSDVTELLGLGKWEAPLPVGGGEIAGPFLSQYASKTDAERVQNLVEQWPALLGHDWFATEKVDGTSCTILRDAEGRRRVCGRNAEIAEGENTYWTAARTYPGLFDALAPGEAVQAEICGPRVQDNRLDLQRLRPFVFALWRDHRYVPWSAWPPAIQEFAAPRLDIAPPATVEEAIAQADGLKTATGNGQRLAEGIVWHTTDGAAVPELEHRDCYKVLNNRYLVKHGL
jgi:RNA ligase (TIGR02306 family)